MNIWEILLIALGLSMDACAVSASNGLCYRDLKLKHILAMAVTFGIFQGIMPIIGYAAGSLFSSKIAAIDHWVALILLCFIGGKMIFDGLKHGSSCEKRSFSLSILLVQGIATSIDALAIGISFAAMKTNIIFSASIIAITTFILSVGAVWVGKKVGDKLNSAAEIFGGSILVLIGIKIFVEHMFFS